MGLQTDIIFVKALREDADLIAQLPAGDVYNTTIALPDEDLDNAPVPYIIVKLDGGTNDESTKDDCESSIDKVNVSIDIAAKTRNQLGALAVQVRKQVHRFIMNAEQSEMTDEEFDMVPLDYFFSFGSVNYDPDKPCYWQTLSYQCDVRNDIIEDENDEQTED